MSWIARIFNLSLLAVYTVISAANIPNHVLVIGQTAEPKSLDPHTVTAVNDFRILVNLYDGLVRYKDKSLEVEPALASSWEISSDHLVYTFHLRENIKFHDGTAFNAEAVKFNFDRLLDPKHPDHKTGPFPLAFFFKAIDKVVVLDETTIQFKLKHPYPPFLSNLAYPIGLIVSPSAVKKYGKDFGRHPVGTGSYQFKLWQSNAKIEVSKNQQYWDKPAQLDLVIFRPITDANTRMAEFLSGGIDILLEPSPDSLSLFRNNMNYQIHETEGPHVWFLILNMKEGPLQNKKVRQAINYGINKEAIVENVLMGTANIASSPIPPAFSWAHNDKLAPYPYNPEKAKKLITESGFENAKLTMYVTEGGSGMLSPVAMGTAIQADLAKIGLDVKIETYEWTTYLSKVNKGLEGQADMAQMAWMTNDPDTLPFLTLRSNAWPNLGGFNSGYYSNPKVDELLEEARSTTDKTIRAKLYRQMQEIVFDDAPWAFIANWKQNAISHKQVKNFVLQPSFFLILNTVKKSNH